MVQNSILDILFRLELLEDKGPSVLKIELNVLKSLSHIFDTLSCGVLKDMNAINIQKERMFSNVTTFLDTGSNKFSIVKHDVKKQAWIMLLTEIESLKGS